MKLTCLFALSALVCLSAAAQTSLTQASFTEVINEVNVVAPGGTAPRTAKVTELFRSPEVLRTGANSLAELKASDNTITRVGANTVFSFENKGRTVNLEKGSVLFHSPKGKGGGVIKSAGASASVLGTTVMVTTMPGGGFKCIVLEGTAQVRLANGDFRILKAGQLLVVNADGGFGPVLDIDLSRLTQGARLLHGFRGRLPSLPLIEGAINEQTRIIELGEAEQTQYQLGPGVEIMDQNVVERTAEQGAQEEPPTPSFPYPYDPEQDLLFEGSTLEWEAGGYAGTKGTRSAATQDLASTTRSAFGSTITARNIYFNTAKLDLADCPFSSLAFNASERIAIMKSIKFDRGSTGPMPLAGSSSYYYPLSLNLNAYQMIIHNGVTIEGVGLSYMNFTTVKAATYNGVTFKSDTGSIRVGYSGDYGDLIASANGTSSTDGNITLNGCKILADGSAYVYGNNLNIQNSTITGSYIDTGHGMGNATVVNSHFTSTDEDTIYIDTEGNVSVSGSTFTTDEEVVLDSYDNNVTVTGSTFDAYQTELDAEGDILVKNSTWKGSSYLDAYGNNITFEGCTFNGGELNLRASTQILLKNLAFSSAPSLNLQAATIVLSDINFPSGSILNLYCSTGLLAPNPNTGAAIQPGYVNFVQNVKYNGQPAQNYVVEGPISIRTLGTTGTLFRASSAITHRSTAPGQFNGLPTASIPKAFTAPRR